MKRIIALILAASITLCGLTFLSGCGNNSDLHILSRGEWINKIAEVFELSQCYDKTPKFEDVDTKSQYFDSIQACKEWGIIEDNTFFNPSDRADVNFAIVTAIKAVGLEKIEKSVNGTSLDTDKDIIDYFNERCSVKYINGANLYNDTADSIINQIGYLYASIELKQYQDIKYVDNVSVIEENNMSFSADGKTATVVTGTYNIGDIVVIEPSQIYPKGKYVKIISIADNKVEYVEPTIDELFDHVTMSGTYEPEIMGVVPLMDGVDVQSINGSQVEPQSFCDNNCPSIIYVKSDTRSCSSEITPLANEHGLGDIDLNINAKVQSGNSSITVAGSVKLKNIKATVDLDILGAIVNKAELKVTDTIESSISFSGQIEKTFGIAKIPCKLWGVVGVNFVLAIKVGLEGSVSFVWSVDTEQSVEYKPFRTPKFHASGSNSNLNVELKAKAYIKPEFKAEFVIGPVSVVNVGAYSGVEASVKTKAVGANDELSCVDVNAYVPLAIFVGAETKKGDDTLLGKLGVKRTWTIWTSSTSPSKKKWHIEDGKIVPKCTKKDKDANTNNSNDSTDNLTDIDMDIINDLVSLEENLGISSYYVAMDENNIDTLIVTFLPDGYNQDELVFSSSNSKIATVNNDGIITALSQGVCTIKVATNDGNFEQFCSVRVMASYDVNFTPLSCFMIGVGKYDYKL